MQHGHMDQVGYDTYCKLLDEVVKEMQGEEIVPESGDVQIDLNVSAFISDEFIEDANQKIETYQNIATCRNEENVQDITDEIIDRFGKTPKEVENLLEITRIKILCKKLNIIKLLQKPEKIVITFIKDKFIIDVEKIIKKYENQIYFSKAQEPYFTYKLKTKNVLKELKDFLLDLSEENNDNNN